MRQSLEGVTVALGCRRRDEEKIRRAGLAKHGATRRWQYRYQALERGPAEERECKHRMNIFYWLMFSFLIHGSSPSFIFEFN
jgi:hypothetical protein